MNELCNALDNCTRPKGHEGDHGHPVSAIPGLIIAPWPNTGEEQSAEYCPLKCLHCSGATQMRKTERGGYITCAKCDEVYAFDPKGYTSLQTTIFPSGDPHKYGDKLKSEFIAHQRAAREFHTEGQYLLGLIDHSAFGKRLIDIEVAINDWWVEDVAINPPKHWWQFWKVKAG